MLQRGAALNLLKEAPEISDGEGGVGITHSSEDKMSITHYKRWSRQYTAW